MSYYCGAYSLTAAGVQFCQCRPMPIAGAVDYKGISVVIDDDGAVTLADINKTDSCHLYFDTVPRPF